MEGPRREITCSSKYRESSVFSLETEKTLLTTKRAAFLHVEMNHKRRSDYGQVAETYSARVLRGCDQRAECCY